MIPYPDAELKCASPRVIFYSITLPAAYQAIGGEHISGNFQEVKYPFREVIDVPNKIWQGELYVPLTRNVGIIDQRQGILIFTHILRTRSTVAKHENSR